MATRNTRSTRPAAKSASRRRATADDGGFRWRHNLACVATYNVLEHGDKMDEFEDIQFPFDVAGDVRMRQLRYWPGITVPASILRAIARLEAQKFLVLLEKNFTTGQLDAGLDRPQVLLSAAALFGNGDATLAELAEVVERSFPFPDET